MTEFSNKVLTYNDLNFTIDGNSKITASNGSYENPEPNAFSVVQIQDCPGSTDICRESCYVHGLEKYAPDLHKRYIENSANIRVALESKEMTAGLVDLFSTWISKNCKEFRWHVSGDVFSEAYALFIKRVCQKTDITFWIYTRSFDFVKILSSVENLIVNISADEDNFEAASVVAKNNNLRICYFTADGTFPELPSDSVIFPDYKLRGRDMDNPKKHDWWTGLLQASKRQVCPVDFFGQSQEMRCGPCNKCMIPFQAEAE